MGLLVVFGGLSLASLASPVPVEEQAAVSGQAKVAMPLHTHASASVYRLPAAPRAASMPAEPGLERVEIIRSKERLPLPDANLHLAGTDRKQGNTSLAMRVVGLRFGLDF